MLVGNFTPDDIKWTHLGWIDTIKAGAIEEFEENRAKHILTKFGQRGLLTIKWEDRDNLSEYRDKAMSVYRQFWEQQVYNFNNQNNQRMNENKAYVSPSKELAAKAKELGLEIIGPWKSTPKTDSQELKDVKAENQSLRDEMAEMRATMRELIETVKAQPVRREIIDTASYLKQFQHLGKDRYARWVVDRLNDLPDFPFVVYEAAFQKWIEFYPGEEWPVAKCRHKTEDNSEVVTDDGDIS